MRSRRAPFVALVALALIASMVPAGARPASGGPTTGGFATDNVEHIRHIPLSTNGVGGRLIGKYFYTNDQNKIMVFDVSDPVDPQLTGVLPMPQEWQFSREDLDGNGKILVVPNTVTRAVYIVDVEDKSNPQIVGEVANAAQHTISCVLGCRYAYGSDGNIIDIRDPANPKLLKHSWGDGPGVVTDNGHDVEEIRPGLVLTASQPIQLLDARNPEKPRLLALGKNTDGRFIHTGRWAQGGRDKFLLMSGETTFNFRCSENSAAFMTWDATKWKKTRTFTMIDEYRMTNGAPTDGNVPAGRNCSSHWHEPHPSFRNGGLVAAAFFEFGTRFIEVSSKGKIEEIGYFLPYAGSTSAVYWITKDIAYAVDYHRGIDILRFTP